MVGNIQDTAPRLPSAGVPTPRATQPLSVASSVAPTDKTFQDHLEAMKKSFLDTTDTGPAIQRMRKSSYMQKFFTQAQWDFSAKTLVLPDLTIVHGITAESVIFHFAAWMSDASRKPSALLSSIPGFDQETAPALLKNLMEDKSFLGVLRQLKVTGGSTNPDNFYAPLKDVSIFKLLASEGDFAARAKLKLVDIVNIFLFVEWSKSIGANAACISAPSSQADASDIFDAASPARTASTVSSGPSTMPHQLGAPVPPQATTPVISRAPTFTLTITPAPDLHAYRRMTINTWSVQCTVKQLAWLCQPHAPDVSLSSHETMAFNETWFTGPREDFRSIIKFKPPIKTQSLLGHQTMEGT